MNKSALRQHYLVQRRALPAEDVAHWSRQIADRLFNDVLAHLSVKTVHTFLPIARQNEVNTWPIVHRIWQDFPAIQVTVPVTDTTFNQLTHYALAPETPLVESRWGISVPEPGSSPTIITAQIDLVLVPLLVFDTLGHRVGYGKGYYDRFLAGCRPDCLKIGLSLLESVECIEGVESTDVRLDACVTPERVWYFGASSRHKNTL